MIRYNTTYSIANTWDQNIVNRFYDGNGREVKRQKTTFAEDVNMTVPPYGSWNIDVPTYYIRSSVLGGETLTEVNSVGRKIKTNVIAAGAKIATQQEYYGGTPSEAVFFENSDASGMSRRTISSTGVAFEGDGGEVSPVEADPMGGNVGTTTPYLEILQPYEPPQEFPDLLPMTMDSPLYVNGQQVTCSLDGMAIGCAQAFRGLGTSSDIDFANSDLSVLRGLGIWWREVWSTREIGPDPNAPGSPEFTITTTETRFVGYEYFGNVSWSSAQTQTRTPNRNATDKKSLRRDMKSFFKANPNCKKALKDLGVDIGDLFDDAKITDLSLDTSDIGKTAAELGANGPGVDEVSLRVRLKDGDGVVANVVLGTNKMYLHSPFHLMKNPVERGRVVVHELLHHAFNHNHTRVAVALGLNIQEKIERIRYSIRDAHFDSDGKFVPGVWGWTTMDVNDPVASNMINNWLRNDCPQPLGE